MTYPRLFVFDEDTIHLYGIFFARPSGLYEYIWNTLMCLLAHFRSFRVLIHSAVLQNSLGDGRSCSSKW